jgi:hypothetical protein
MANTRFNYDECRTKKYLQQSTGPGRYIMNAPGNGIDPTYTDEPQIRLQKWGGNLREVQGGHPIDIDSELIGLNRRTTKYESIKTKKLVTEKKYYDKKSYKIDETRATHPAWKYRDLEQTRWEYPLIDPQMNTEIPFSYNNNSSNDYKDSFIPNIPKPLNK